MASATRTKFCCCCCREDYENLESPKLGETDQNATITTFLEPESEVLTQNAPDEVFVGPVPYPLLPGHAITITGKIPQKCTAYAINLKVDPAPGSDIALHLNPRLEQNYIVRNSLVKGKWGREETTSSYKIDLYKKPTFKFTIFVSPSEYFVTMNDKYFTSYKHRIPPAKVIALVVQGNVVVNSVKTTEEPEFPIMVLEYPRGIPCLPIVEPQEEEEYPMPFWANVVKEFGENWQVEIKGRVKLLPQRFFVNLQDGAQVWPHPNITFHLNPRFDDGPAHVVCNTWMHNAWGMEERSENCKFYPGRPFHLIIRYSEDNFSIWINETMTLLYKFRNLNIPTTTINIQGDVHIYKVWVNKVDNIFLMIKKSRISRRKIDSSKRIDTIDHPGSVTSQASH